MESIPLYIGLIFPLISWLSLIVIIISKALGNKQNISGVYIPFIGPAFISYWLLMNDYDSWYLLLPWMLDLGSVIFILYLPKLANEIWEYSRFTKLAELQGSRENGIVRISLHSNGKYVMIREWNKDNNEPGPIRLSQPGIWSKENGDIKLESHTGVTKILIANNGEYSAIDYEPNKDQSIEGWVLKNA